MNKEISRVFLTLIFTALIGPIAMDIFIPALPMIKDHFNISIIETQYTLSFFVLSFGLFQVLTGFISDRYGVFYTLLIALCVFIAWEYIFYFQIVLATIGIGLVISNITLIDKTLECSGQKKFKSYYAVIKDLEFWRYAIFGSGGMVMLFMIFSIAPYILLEQFFLNRSQFPIIFSFCSLGFILGNISTTMLIKKVKLDIILNLSYSCITFLSLGMIMLENHIMCLKTFIIFIFCFNFFIGMSFGSAMSGALRSFKQNASIASSIYGAQQFITAFSVITFLVKCQFVTYSNLFVICLITSILTLLIHTFLTKYKSYHLGAYHV